MLFGHHFAAIAGAGPLVGPVLAAQFGFAPGCCGWWPVARWAVPSTISCACGRRPGAGASRWPRSPVPRSVRSPEPRRIAILFILIVALAGLGIAVVNALAESAWSTFTIGVTIPIGMLMGFHMFVFRKGRIRKRRSSASCYAPRPLSSGSNVAESSLGHDLVLTRHQVTAAMAHLRPVRVDSAGVDAADTARLPEHVHEDRHDRYFWPSA